MAGGLSSLIAFFSAYLRTWFEVGWPTNAALSLLDSAGLVSVPADEFAGGVVNGKLGLLGFAAAVIAHPGGLAS